MFYLKVELIYFIIGLKNLFVIETVDSIKLADLLNSSIQNSSKLNIMIQLNTSDEPRIRFICLKIKKEKEIF